MAKSWTRFRSVDFSPVRVLAVTGKTAIMPATTVFVVGPGPSQTTRIGATAMIGMVCSRTM
jgi:hypothetical protein